MSCSTVESRSPPDGDAPLFLSRLSAIWKGFIKMQSVSKFVTKAYPVSGCFDYLSEVRAPLTGALVQGEACGEPPAGQASGCACSSGVATGTGGRAGLSLQGNSLDRNSVSNWASWPLGRSRGPCPSRALFRRQPGSAACPQQRAALLQRLAAAGLLGHACLCHGGAGSVCLGVRCGTRLSSPRGLGSRGPHVAGSPNVPASVSEGHSHPSLSKRTASRLGPA